MSHHVTDQLDDYLHGVLYPDAAEAVEAHVAACPACAAGLDAARRRRSVLVAALPQVEPTSGLVRDTMSRIAGDGPARRRQTIRVLAALFTPLIAAAIVLVLFQNHYTGLRASPANLELLGQRDWLSGGRAAVRVRLTDGRTHAPLGNWPVNAVLTGGPDGVPRVLPTAKTDALGTCELAV